MPIRIEQSGVQGEVLERSKKKNRLEGFQKEERTATSIGFPQNKMVNLPLRNQP